MGMWIHFNWHKEKHTHSSYINGLWTTYHLSHCQGPRLYRQVSPVIPSTLARPVRDAGGRGLRDALTLSGSDGNMGKNVEKSWKFVLGTSQKSISNSVWYASVG